MEEKNIPDIVVGRLPLYLRALQQMVQAGGKLTSSQELAERLGVSAAQIRKDLSQFGEFGKQGTGYNVKYLLETIRRILHVDRDWDVVMVGAGELGSAVARYRGFTDRGFTIKMIFDSDPAKVGQVIGGYTILDSAEMGKLISEHGIQMAMLTVPASEAQAVTDRLVKAGIKAILNYAPITINVPEGVHIQYIDPALHLQRMAYYIHPV